MVEYLRYLEHGGHLVELTCVKATAEQGRNQPELSSRITFTGLGWMSSALEVHNKAFLRGLVFNGSNPN
jgi:hypothetical protein